MTSTHPQRTGILMTLGAVVCFSTAPVFVLVAQGTFSPLEIAFWRVAIGTAFVGILGAATGVALRLRREQWPRFALYGLVLALHLSAYVAALRFTSIAHAVAITYTSPVWIALIAVFLLHERLTLGTVIGLAIAVVGIAVLNGFQPAYGYCDIQGGHCAMLGDGLALAAAICASIYAIAGRLERDRHPLFRYTFYVYGFAALWLAPVTIVLASRHGYPLPAIGAVFALGLVPLGMGHTLYNAALRHVNATLVNLLATQEITGGIVLGILFFRQIPSLLGLTGVGITLVGIVIVMLKPPQPPALSVAMVSSAIADEE